MWAGMSDIHDGEGVGAGTLVMNREARMRAHTSLPAGRIEIVTRGARRRWSTAQKLAIVEASLAPGAMISELCRRHEIGSGQLSVWRRLYRDGGLGAVPAFARAVVSEAAFPASGPAGTPARDVGPGRRVRAGRGCTAETIEIALPDGTIVRVGSAVDQAALARVLAALRGA